MDWSGAKRFEAPPESPCMNLAGRRVLITGATAGIGEATARAFVHHGATVIATGRRKDRLRKLVAELNREGPGTAEALPLDVTKPRSVARLQSLEVDILVNNAGLARGKGPLQIGEFADWKEMVDTNILGVLAVFKACIPSLMERKGHVVNLGSVAGRWVYPGGNVYSATKFAVRALSESMRLDLAGTGIRVTNIAPGAVDTEFSLVRYKGDASKAAKTYQGYEPLHAADIAESILWCCSRPAHVDVQELVIFPTAQASVRDVSLSTPTVVEKATLRFDAPQQAEPDGEQPAKTAKRAPKRNPKSPATKREEAIESSVRVAPRVATSAFRARYRS